MKFNDCLLFNPSFQFLSNGSLIRISFYRILQRRAAIMRPRVVLTLSMKSTGRKLRRNKSPLRLETMFANSCYKEHWS